MLGGGPCVEPLRYGLTLAPVATTQTPAIGRDDSRGAVRAGPLVARCGIGLAPQVLLCIRLTEPGRAAHLPHPDRLRSGLVRPRAGGRASVTSTS